MNPRNRSIWLNKTMPKIDLWATTKSLNNRTEERAALGLGRVIFVNNSYDSSFEYIYLKPPVLFFYRWYYCAWYRGALKFRDRLRPTFDEIRSLDQMLRYVLHSSTRLLHALLAREKQMLPPIGVPSRSSAEHASLIVLQMLHYVKELHDCGAEAGRNWPAKTLPQLPYPRRSKEVKTVPTKVSSKK